MTQRPPTAPQLSLLQAIATDKVRARSLGARRFAYYRQGSSRRFDGPVSTLASRGWVEVDIDTGSPILTPAGERALADARDLDDWSMLTGQLRPEVIVTQRGATAAAGRNVKCFVPGCSAADPRSHIVWFTDEPGALGRREAEKAQAWHGMSHIRDQERRPG